MKKKLNIVILGSSGKMGTEVLGCLKGNNAAQVFATVARPGGLKEIKISAKERPAVLVDFSSPKGFVEGLRFSCKNKIGFVSGTTGLTTSHMRLLRSASGHIPVFWAPLNFRLAG